MASSRGVAIVRLMSILYLTFRQGSVYHAMPCDPLAYHWIS